MGGSWEDKLPLIRPSQRALEACFLLVYPISRGLICQRSDLLSDSLCLFVAYHKAEASSVRHHFALLQILPLFPFSLALLAWVGTSQIMYQNFKPSLVPRIWHSTWHPGLREYLCHK